LDALIESVPPAELIVPREDPSAETVVLSSNAMTVTFGLPESVGTKYSALNAPARSALLVRRVSPVTSTEKVADAVPEPAVEVACIPDGEAVASATTETEPADVDDWMPEGAAIASAATVTDPAELAD
jgi:hypothetical protein|tara:strand:- start:2931 stop:3314 length:384 start_codon:yes stop_codon:yes gene_type:complete